jgi:hypothetical protein
MNKKFAVALKLSALSLAMLAAGCGGGGSSSTPDEVAATRSVQGTAAKGIIKGGLVQVYALDAQGKKGATPVATGKTGNDGTFTVSIPKDVLLFVVEVSATAGAVMADEATGTDIALPTNMVLRNVVKLEAAAESYTGSVSPLTEMAVKTAEKAGGLTATNVAQAKAGVTAMLGFDPETVKPVNANSAAAATATPEQKTQALLLAAISKMAKDGALGCVAADVTCVVNKVANSATVSGSSITMGEVGAALETVTKAVASDTTINKTGVTTVSLPAIKVTIPAEQTSSVAAAKAMVASLRTNLNTFANGAVDIEARADKVNVAFDKMVEPVDDGLINWMKTPAAAINYFMAYKAGTKTSPTAMISWMNGSNCNIYSDADSKVLSVSKDDALNIACVVDRKFIPTLNKSVAQVIKITPGTGNEHAYKTHTRFETKTGGQRDSSKDVDIGTRVGGTITYAPNSSNSFALHGKLPVRTDAAGTQLTDYEEWDLAASSTADATAGTTKYEVTAAMTSYLAGQAVGKLSINPGSQLIVNSAVTGDFAFLESGDVKDFNLSISGESAGSTISGSVKLKDWKADKNSEYAPTDVTFTGAITEASKPFFDGSLNIKLAGFDKFDSMSDISDTNFVGRTVTLNGSMALPDRPTLALFLTASELSVDKHTLVGEYNDGTTTIVFSGYRTLPNAEIKSLKVASTTGVSFEVTQQNLDNATQDLPVMRNSAKVAQINLKTGVITYTDNTFESLK